MADRAAEQRRLRILIGIGVVVMTGAGLTAHATRHPGSDPQSIAAITVAVLAAALTIVAAVLLGRLRRRMRPTFLDVLRVTMALSWLSVAAGLLLLATGHRSSGLRVAVFAALLVLWSYLHYRRESRR